MSLPLTNRTEITGGPAAVIYNSGYFYSADAISMPAGIKLFEIPSDAYQSLDKRVDDEEFKLSFKPVGEWEHLSILYPYLSTVPGSLIFGADSPLDIWSLTDDKVTRFYSAAITKQPDIRFKSNETLLQNVEFSMLRKNLVGRETANSLYTEADLRDGTFTLTYGVDTTSALAFNSTAAQVAAALNGLATIIAAGLVTVSGNYRNGFTVTFVTVGDKTQISGAVSGFPTTTLTTAIATATTTGGTGSVYEVQTIHFTPWKTIFESISVASIYTQPYEFRWLSNGTFTLTYGADTTSALDWDSTAAEVQTALNALTSITAAGGVTVAGSVNDEWTVTFVSVGVRTAISGAVTGMPPATTVNVVETTAGTVSVAEVQTIKLAPWASFGSIDGGTLTFNDNFAPRVTESEGLTNMRYMGGTATVTLIPDGITSEEILAGLKVQGSGAVRGRSLNAGSQNLDIVGTGVFVRVYGANLGAAELRYAVNQDRVGEIAFESTRVISAGTVSNVAYVGTAAP